MRGTWQGGKTGKEAGWDTISENEYLKRSTASRRVLERYNVIRCRSILAIDSVISSLLSARSDVELRLRAEVFN